MEEEESIKIWHRLCDEAQHSLIQLRGHPVLNKMLGIKNQEHIHKMTQSIGKIIRHEGLPKQVLQTIDHQHYRGVKGSKKYVTINQVNLYVSPSVLRIAQFVLTALSYFRKQGLKRLVLVQWTGFLGDTCLLCLELAPYFGLQVEDYFLWDKSGAMQQQFKALEPSTELHKVRVHFFKSLDEMKLEKNNLCLLGLSPLSSLQELEQKLLYRTFRRTFKHGLVMWIKEKEPEEAFFQISPRMYEHLQVKTPFPMLHLHERWFYF